MKVLYVHHNPDKGGASNSLLILLKELKNKGVDISVATPAGPVVESFKKLTTDIHIIDVPTQLISTYGVGFPYLRTLRTVIGTKANKQIKTILRELHPDIVHLNEIVLIQLAKNCKKLGYKVAMHVRVVIDARNRIATRLYHHFINKYVDHLICIDGSAARPLKVSIPKSIIYNPLNKLGKKIETAQSKEKFNCLFLGNFLKFKGIFDVVQAAILLSSNPNINFYIAGSNVKTEFFFNSTIGKVLNRTGIYPNIQKKLEKLIRKHDLQNIIFLGFQKVDEQLFINKDVLVNPIRMNQPSRSVFEAGSYGIPTILSMVHKEQDLIQHGVTGLIIDEKNPHELANAILKLHKDRHLLKKMSTNCHVIYNKRHSVKLAGDAVLNVYSKIL